MIKIKVSFSFWLWAVFCAALIFFVLQNRNFTIFAVSLAKISRMFYAKFWG